MNKPGFGPEIAFREQPVGEPFTKVDGTVVAAYVFPLGLNVDIGDNRATYFDKDVETLGEGNWSNGMMRIMQSACSDTFDPSLGEFRPFQSTLKSED